MRTVYIYSTSLMNSIMTDKKAVNCFYCGDSLTEKDKEAARLSYHCPYCGKLLDKVKRI